MVFMRIVPEEQTSFVDVRTIDEAIEYNLKHANHISKEEMIALAKADLEINKIDISSDDYDIQNDKAFRKLDTIFVSEDGKVISESWFVEKYMIGQERIESKYGCYLMGLDRKLTEEELEWDYLYKQLDIRYPDSDAKRNITRTDKKGLLIRIKETLGFDLNDFPNEQQARMKLLYLLYCFEREFGVEFSSYFNNPTLENTDDLIVNVKTKNGHLMEYLKRQIVRELDTPFILTVNSLCCKMIEDWENQLRELMFKLDTIMTRNTKDELVSECNLALELFEPVEHITEHGKYKHSLLETVYLKLWQHENLGRENDILDVTQRTQEFLSNLPNNLTKYQKLAGKTIYKKDLKKYVYDNRKTLAQLVFESDTITSNQYKKFDIASDKVELYLEMLNDNTSVNKFVDIPELLVIAAIQEIINLDKKEVLPNKFYRHSTSEQRTLNSELSYGSRAFRKNQLAWVARVNTRYNAYNGRKEESLLVYRTQSVIDKIIVTLFKINSITDMLVFHNFFLQLVEEVLISEDLLNKNIKRFEKSVGRRKKGYIVRNLTSNEARRFFTITINSGIVDQLAKKVAKITIAAERVHQPIKFSYPFELTGNYSNDSDEYKVEFIVDPLTKTIDIATFELDITPDKKQILKENGITIL